MAATTDGSEGDLHSHSALEKDAQSSNQCEICMAEQGASSKAIHSEGINAALAFTEKQKTEAEQKKEEAKQKATDHAEWLVTMVKSKAQQ